MAHDVDEVAAALLRTLDEDPREIPLLGLLRQAALPAAPGDTVPTTDAIDAKLCARATIAALGTLLQRRAIALWLVDHWEPSGAGAHEHALGPAIRSEAGDVSLVPVVMRAGSPAPEPTQQPRAAGGVARRLVPPYLLVQALLVAAWWLVLWLVPSARAPFVVGDWPEGTLLAFALPDVAVLVVGSAAAAFGLRAGRAWARPLLWLVAGAVLYATLWCLGANAVTGAGWLPTAMMLACATAMGFVVAAVR